MLSVKKISDRVEKNFVKEVGFLASLVKQKSVNEIGTPRSSAVEVGVARLIRKQLVSMGLKARYLRAHKSRPNVISEWGSVRARKSLILTGHMDTDVPVGVDKSSWFSAKVMNNRMYGAGVLNMKASLVSYIFALKALMDLKMNPVGRLKLVFTVDGTAEITSNLGLKYLVRKGLKGNAALLAKPEMNKIAIGHRGGYRFKLVTYGEAVNTGRRVWERGERGKNAILDMARVIRVLSDFDLPYKPAKAFPGRSPVFTFPTKIVGGRMVSVVPDMCEAWGDVRLLPGNTDMQVKMWMEEKLSSLKGVNWKLFDEFYVPAMEIERGEKLVQILLEQAEKELKYRPKIEGCGPWNDAWVLTCADTPCIAGFGPEGQEGSDEENEWVDLGSVKSFTKILANSIWLYLQDLRDKNY